MNHDFRSAIWGIAAGFYTFLTALGLTFVYLRRRTVAVRLRGWYYMLASVLTLHGYGLLILIAYILNGRYPCGVEFWVMNTLLPYGMALFQRKLSSHVSRLLS